MNTEQNNNRILCARRYTNLTVCDFGKDYRDRHNHRMLKVRCDCGNISIKTISFLRNRKYSECYCHKTKSNGWSLVPEYKVWLSMLIRCYSIETKDYIHYGGRGITVCDEWKNSFEIFYKDMGKRPNKFYTLERVNNELGYFKYNCKWATWKEQANNKRNNLNYTEKYNT